jgi:hypothetical protein
MYLDYRIVTSSQSACDLALTLSWSFLILPALAQETALAGITMRPTLFGISFAVLLCFNPAARAGLIAFDVSTQIQPNNLINLTPAANQTYSASTPVPGSINSSVSVTTPAIAQVPLVQATPPAWMIPLAVPSAGGGSTISVSDPFNFQVKITDRATGQSGTWYFQGVFDLSYTKSANGPWTLAQDNILDYVTTNPWLPQSNLVTLYGQTGKMIGNTFYQVWFTQYSTYPANGLGDMQPPLTSVPGYVIEAGTMPTPEPGTFLLAALGLVAVAGLRWRGSRRGGEATSYPLTS